MPARVLTRDSVLEDKWGLANITREHLLALWNACRAEYISREKTLVRQFQIGDPVEFRLGKGPMFHGVVLGRNMRTVRVGVRVEDRAVGFSVSPFKLTLTEDDEDVANARMYFKIECRPGG